MKLGIITAAMLLAGCGHPYGTHYALYASPSLAPAQVEVMAQAADDWEANVPVTIVLVVGECPGGDTSICVSAAPTGVGSGHDTFPCDGTDAWGCTQRHEDGATTRFSSGMPAWAWGYVMRHELGHAMGLSHDPDMRSVMYPSTDANLIINGVTCLDVRQWSALRGQSVACEGGS
jgi:hypothetical protein